MTTGACWLRVAAGVAGLFLQSGCEAKGDACPDAENPGDHVYVIKDAPEISADSGAWIERADLEGAEIVTTADTLQVRYTGPDGQDVVVTFLRTDL